MVFIKELKDFEKTILEIEKAILQLNYLLDKNNKLIKEKFPEGVQGVALGNGGIFATLSGKKYREEIKHFQKAQEKLINSFSLNSDECKALFSKLQNLISLSHSQKVKLVDQIIDESNALIDKFINYKYIIDHSEFISKRKKKNTSPNMATGALILGSYHLKLQAEEEARYYEELKVDIVRELNDINEKLIQIKTVAQFTHDESIVLRGITHNLLTKSDKLTKTFDYTSLSTEDYEQCLKEKQMLELFLNSLVQNFKNFKGHVSQKQIDQLLTLKNEFETNPSFKQITRSFKWTLLTM
ncbi:hypothetical protein [Lysinibacillus boronitolerans]|uniref:hypothetical protein n=1 Tax=Lysinibacillus boronitolerans TaxID=309788 RepID=UPI0028A1E833|nr:hypothetical protein [Bacillus mobilis]